MEEFQIHATFMAEDIDDALCYLAGRLALMGGAGGADEEPAARISEIHIYSTATVETGKREA